MNLAVVDPFQELVDSLCKVLSTPVYTPTASPSPVSATATSSAPIYTAITMVNPAPYSGSVDECNGFLLQCSLILELQQHRFPSKELKSPSYCLYSQVKCTSWLNLHGSKTDQQTIHSMPSLLISERFLEDRLEISPLVSNYTIFVKARAPFKIIISNSEPK